MPRADDARKALARRNVAKRGCGSLHLAVGASQVVLAEVLKGVLARVLGVYSECTRGVLGRPRVQLITHLLTGAPRPQSAAVAALAAAYAAALALLQVAPMRRLALVGVLREYLACPRVSSQLSVKSAKLTKHWWEYCVSIRITPA